MMQPATLQPAAAIGRLGTETVFEVLARATELEAQGRDIVHLAIGQPDFPTPPHIVEAGIRALRDGQHGYTPTLGIRPLREAVAADVESRLGVAVDPDHVMIVPGAKVTLFFAVLMFGEPGAEILYPDPGFPIYESAIRFTGAEPVPMPLHEASGFSFDAGEVLARVNGHTRLIILNSPANPTGGVTPRAELAKLAAGLARHPRVAVLSDEIYSRLIYDGREHASPAQFPEIADRVILMDGWSKSYAMTGWRLGYGVWPRALIEGAARLAVNCHSCVNAAAQWAGLAALTGPQDCVESMRRAFAERRAITVQALNQLPGFRCAEPGGAFYAFPNISATGRGARELQRLFLEQAGVATVAGTSFGRSGAGFLRISYANSTDNILKAIARMRAVL